MNQKINDLIVSLKDEYDEKLINEIIKDILELECSIDKNSKDDN